MNRNTVQKDYTEISHIFLNSRKKNSVMYRSLVT